MVFSSISFLLYFLPSLLILYYLIPKKARGVRNLLLLAYSLFFYAYGGPRFLIVMGLSIVFNYVCGLLASDWNSHRIRKLGVVLACVLGLGMLAWFKYSKFFAVSLNSLGTNLPIPDVVLPIGISFFTFHGLSYVIDIYRGDAKAMKNPVKLALYISFFPQLVAGPIVRYSTVSNQLGGRKESFEDFSEGAVRFVFGLAKKMLIANPMGVIADQAFGTQTSALTTSLAWIGALAYTAQIYFDFSGYSDMALGLGRMFGFHFLENFNYPYISQSVTEFWRRWHISLSTWFRDYLYIPLGGNRCSKSKHIRNIFIVWFMTGLWHGAAWTFIAWGMWFCLLLLGEKYVWGDLLKKSPRAVRHIYTMLLVVLSWVLFRSDSFGYAFKFAGAMFGLAGAGAADGQSLYILKEYWFELLLAVVACMPVKDAAKRFLESRSERPLARYTLNWGPCVFALALLGVSYAKLVTSSFNPFIYYKF